MTQLGYTLSCEEHRPGRLVDLAVQAEEAGFPFATISDHYHPWTDEQGQSPFVWAVLGGVAQATSRIELGTAVTCPSRRVHPAVVAQAAATVAAMMPGRFFLGVGSGENLNEHVVGEAWPPASIRLEMLEEAVGIIRHLWEGGQVTHTGRHYQVHTARIYTLPDPLPPIHVAAAGAKSAELAGRIGDGLVAVSPSAQTVAAFAEAGGRGKPCYGQVHVCWAEDEAEARRTARRVWPNAAIPGELSQELPSPAHFEQAAARVSEDDVAESVICGSDPERHLAAITEYFDAGYEHVTVHQVGDDQEGFFAFYRSEILPKVG